MLKTFTSIAALAAVLAFTAPASAQEVVGVIKQYNPSTRLIILEDGNQYIVNEGVTVQEFQPGTRVKFMVEERAGKRYITRVITSP